MCYVTDLTQRGQVRPALRDVSTLRTIRRSPALVGSEEIVTDSRGRAYLGRSAAVDLGTAPNTAVRHAEWGDRVVMSVEPDRVKVLFDQVGYKTLSVESVTQHDLLREA